MKRKAKSFLLISISLSILRLIGLAADVNFPSNFSSFGGQIEVDAIRRETISKGLRWIFAHPATFEKDRLIDIVEEIMLLYHLYLTLCDLNEKLIYRKHIMDRIIMIEDKKYKHIKNPVESTAFLVLADISDKLDIDNIDFKPIIEKEIRGNLLSYPPPPQTAFAVWNSVLLLKLGYIPLYLPAHLLSKGTIATLAQNPHLLDVNYPAGKNAYIMNKFYEITHEIFALGSLGNDYISLLGNQEMQYLKNIIPKGMAKYMKDKEIDILAELVVCSKMLGFTDFEEYQKAVDLITKSQLADGSFGVTKRMIQMKKHPFRHGVLTSIWALL
jgi:hypothetical protein